MDALNEVGKPLKRSKVCVLEVAYKKDVDDPRNTKRSVAVVRARIGKA